MWLGIPIPVCVCSSPHSGAAELQLSVLEEEPSSHLYPVMSSSDVLERYSKERVERGTWL